MDELERRSRRELYKARKAIEKHKANVLSKAQYTLDNWARNNPDMAKYDNDGQPIENNKFPRRKPTPPEYMH